MAECIFCEIVKGKMPSKKVYEDNDILAFDDINPAAPVHVLIVTKKHLKNFIDLNQKDKKLLSSVFSTAEKIAEELGIIKAFKLTLNNGKMAGQIVPHFHLHLLGGWEDKKDIKSEIHT